MASSYPMNNRNAATAASGGDENLMNTLEQLLHKLQQPPAQQAGDNQNKGPQTQSQFQYQQHQQVQAQAQDTDQQLQELLKAQLQQFQSQNTQSRQGACEQTQAPQQQQQQQGGDMKQRLQAQIRQLEEEERQHKQRIQMRSQQQQQQNQQQQQGPDLNVDNLLLQLLGMGAGAQQQQSNQQQQQPNQLQLQQLLQGQQLNGGQNMHSSTSNNNYSNLGQFGGMAVNSNNMNNQGQNQFQSPPTNNTNQQLSQLFMNQGQSGRLGGGNSSLSNGIQRALGQQQQSGNPTGLQAPQSSSQDDDRKPTAMTGLLQSPDQFTNQDRLFRGGRSIVSDNSSATRQTGSPLSGSGNTSIDGGATSSAGASSKSSGPGHHDAHGVDPSYPLKGIEYPGQNDCMFGRGGGTSNHIGNINFRLLVEKFKKRYAAAPKADKPKVTDEVVNEWRARTPPGRFLTRTDAEDSMSKWHDVGDKRARRKCAQALREKQSRCWNEGCDQDAGVVVTGQPAAKKQKVTV